MITTKIPMIDRAGKELALPEGLDTSRKVTCRITWKTDGADTDPSVLLRVFRLHDVPPVRAADPRQRLERSEA